MSTHRQRPLRAVLVDIDGTLVDSNAAHARTWRKTLASQGHEFPEERIRPLIGKGGDKLLAELLPALGQSVKQSLSEARGKRFVDEELHDLSPTLGARQLLEALRARGLKIVVATSAQASESEGLLRQAGLDDLIDTGADSDAAEDSKPDPDIVQAALRRADVRPSEAVMLGDTPWDIEAATRAGVPAIALRCGGWWNDSAFHGALEVWDDPADMARHLDQSGINR